MKRKILIPVIVGVFLVAPIARADEINPDPDSYTFGSTSEFSPYSSIGQGPNPTPTPDSLAPTGQNAWFLYLLATILIASPVVYFGVKKFKE